MELDMKIPKEVEKLAKMIVKLEPAEFIGVCKILGVEIYTIGDTTYEYDAADRQDLDNNADDVETPETAANVRGKMNVEVNVKEAEELIQEVFDKLANLNRTQRRNLMKLLKPATKGR